MSNLLTLQDQFQKFLLDNTLDFKNMVISTEQIPADVRLAVYSNAYQSRLIDALSHNYPVLAKYLGEDAFNKIAADYLAAHPSTQPSLRWFGDVFAKFLSQHEDCKEYPYLAELAEFEWTQTLVFDAADKDPLQIHIVANIPPEAWGEMRLIFHPSIYRVYTYWNVVQIWQAICDEKIPDEPIESSSPIQWVLWRYDSMNRFYSLTTEEAWAVDAIIKGLTFGEICEKLCEWIDENEVGGYAASLLKSWIQSGLITEIIY